MSERDRALISVRPDGFVDGASYAGVCDDEFRAEAAPLGFEVREVDRDYAKQVWATYIPINGGATLPA